MGITKELFIWMYWYSKEIKIILKKQMQEESRKILNAIYSINVNDSAVQYVKMSS